MRQIPPLSCPIAVTGLACWYPGAANPRELWENILSRRRQFRNIPPRRLSMYDYYSSEVDSPDKTYLFKAALIDGFEFDWKARRTPYSTFRATDISHWLALEVALMALADAGYKPGSVPGEKTGVIVGNSLTGDQSRANAMRLRWPFFRRAVESTSKRLNLSKSFVDVLTAALEIDFKSVFPPSSEDSLSGGLSNTIAGRICNYLNLKGGGYTVDGACASSLLSVATAAAALERGDLDMAFAGGVDVSIDPFELVGFAKAKALTDSDMTVYDRRGNGFIPAEGCGFVVLKRLEDAIREGSYVYATINGWGISSDGSDAALTAPSVDGQVKALKRAYAGAPFGPESIALIEGHGTGTAVGDKIELESISMVVENKDDQEAGDLRSCGITSIKSIIGHAKAAAGIAGFIKTVIALNQRISPPVAACRDKHPVFEQSARKIFPIIDGIVHPPEENLKAGVSSMGFGGINCHIALSSGDAPSAKLAPAIEPKILMASNSESELVAITAPSIDAMRKKIRRIIRISKGISIAELTDLAAEAADEVNCGDALRCCVIAEKPEELLDRLRRTLSIIDVPPQKNGLVMSDSVGGIWYGHPVEAPRVGMLFPGQGSQKINMADKLVRRFKWAAKIVDEACRIVEQSGGNRVDSIMFRAVDRALDKSQEAEWAEMLARTEIAHPAICLASIIWLRRLHDLGIKPFAVGGHGLGELTAFFAAGVINEKTLFELCTIRGQALSGYRNGPGKTAGLGRDTKDANSKEPIRGYANVALPGKLSAGLKARLFSGLNGQEIVPGALLRPHFCRQILSPVYFPELVRSMAEVCDVFIETGPGRVLSDLVRIVLHGSDVETYPVEPEPGAESDLYRLVAALFVRGARIDMPNLFENRLIRSFVPANKRIFFENPCENLPLFNPISNHQATGSEMDCADYDLFPEKNAGEQIAEKSATYQKTKSRGEMESMLYSLVEKLTGFQKESLSPELRLLEDLNLDSIKAGDLLVKAAQSAGVGAELVPLDFANASLAEILDKLEASRDNSVSAGARNSYLHPDSNRFLNSFAETPWVREFRVNMVPEPLPSAGGDLEKLIDRSRHGSDAFVVYSDGCIVSRDTALAIGDLLVRNGSNPRIALFENAFEKDFGRLSARSTLIFISSAGQTELKPEESLAIAVDRLSKLARIVSGPGSAVKSFTVIEFGGGRFGASNNEAGLHCCCSSAFIKSVHLERPNLRVRVLDFPPALPKTVLAEKSLLETFSPKPFVAAGYDEKGTRRVPAPEVLEPSQYKSSAIQWSDRDVILVTGGAKGITALIARELAKITRAKMALVGRTVVADGKTGEVKPSEIERLLKTYEEFGLEARYYSCDVSDKRAVSLTVEKIKREMGAVSGVIHGAAVNIPRPVSQVSPVEAFDEIAPKVLGAMNIINAVRGGHLKIFVGFSSIIAHIGMPGNAWYGFSNEALEAILSRFGKERPETRTLCVAYSIWSEEGMGVRMGSTERLRRLGIGAIASSEGVKRFLRLFTGESGNHRVIITSRIGGIHTWEPKILPAPEHCRFLENPLFITPKVESVFKTRLTLDSDPYLKDHYFNGSYLFPTVFGLEAMAQAAAYTIGLDSIERVRIENIRLRRPITVDPEFGADIIVRALARERRPGERTKIVKTGIIKSGAGFEKDFFSAKFIFGLRDHPPAEKIEKPSSSVGIRPEYDLYRDRMLFQGPLYQRIEKVLEILHPKQNDSEQASEAFFESIMAPWKSNSRASFRSAEKALLLLGDPFFRDALLQSGGLLAPKKTQLPFFIRRLDIYPRNIEQETPFVCKAKLLMSDDRQLACKVLSVDSEGKILEKMEGYYLKILGFQEKNPTPADLVRPEIKDNEALRKVMEKFCKVFSMTMPVVKLKYFPGIHTFETQKRRELQISLIRETAAEALKRSPVVYDEIEIQWTDKGKPFLRRPKDSPFQVSVSHDDRLCMCVCGDFPQGCDSMPVEKRGLDEWKKLAGPGKERLLETLIAGGDTVDFAGSRVWAAMEASKKATGKSPSHISMEKREKFGILFKTKTGDEELNILTAAIHLTWGPERVIAMVVESDAAVARKSEKEADFDEFFTFRNFQNMKTDHRGRTVFVYRLPVTFKPNSHLSRKVYFSHYFQWLGEVREAAIWPVLRKLGEQIATGDWGLVTNSSRMRILGEAAAQDNIEIRLWAPENDGPGNPVMDLTFDFRKALPEGGFERLAWCEQQVTWVRILDHGIVKPKPYPEYYWNLMKKLLHPRDETSLLEPLSEPLLPLRNSESEETLYQAPLQPDVVPILFEKTMETSLDNSNLVGNIYFTNYHSWQGQVRDLYFYSLIPEYFRGVGKSGELVCLDCSVTHLREAMPFDRIAVTMALKTLRKQSAVFYFEYFRIEPDNSRIKLAFGEHDATWVLRDDLSNPIPSPFPKKIQDAFLNAIAKYTN